MQNYYTYTAEQDERLAGARPYREVLLFQLINHIDRECLTDAERQELTDPAEARRRLLERSILTLEQKRRLRNAIYRQGMSDIRAFNEALEQAKAEGQRLDEEPLSQYDPEVFVNAFFKTDYGRNYQSYRDEWTGDGAMVSRFGPEIREWTRPFAKGEPRRTVISPYDPMFSRSDLFTDETDELGYMIGVVDRNGNPKIGTKTQRPMFSGNNTVLVDGQPYIKSVQLGRGKTIAPYSELVNISFSEPMHELEGELVQSGYYEISHFIRTKEDKEAVRKAMVDKMHERDENGNERGPVSEDERRFMGDVCRYLSGRGMDFTVKVAGDGHIIASVASPKADIRILSRGDEQYQGRIYSDGVVTRLSMPSNVADIADSITSEDRLNMIRWYFGETVRVNDDRLRDGNRSAGYNHNVGEARHRLTIGTQTMNSVSVSTGRSMGNSIAFAVKRRESGGYALVSIMQSSSSVNYEEDLPETSFAKSLELKDSAFGTGGEMNPFVNNDARIPVDKLLPGDFAEVPDENGNMARVRHIRHDTDKDYYRHLIAREKLNEWMESARANHAAMVDIDGMVEYYRTVYSVEPDAPFDFSEDDNVAEVQQQYWDVLTGNIDIGSTDLEDKIADIRARYDGYLDDAFGMVPEISRPDLGVTYPASLGFNPAMVARYVNTPDSYGIQKNQSFIRHMLLRMGDDYDPSFIRGDDYVANSIKNALVGFDKDAVRADFSLMDIMRGNGVDDIDPEKVRNLPGLENMPFTRSMLVSAADTLAKSGCHPESVRVRVDENGVIEYTGYVSTAKVTNGGKNAQPLRDYHDVISSVRTRQERAGVPANQRMQFATFDDTRTLPENLPEGDELRNDVAKLHRVHGFIGQVFEPDRYGAIKQRTVVEDNRILIPGYDAYLLENDPEDPRPMAERLRLIGLEQRMRLDLQTRLRAAVFTMDAEYAFEPHGADLNGVYRRTYDMVLDEPYYNKMMPKTSDRSKMTDEEKFFLRVMETMRGRCRFPNEYGEGSTTMAQSYLEHPNEEAAKQFDYYYSDLCDNVNLRVLGREFDYIFDRDMTGTAKLQGIVRQLVRGAVVNPDGSVTMAPRGPGHREPHCALMWDPAFRTMYHNSWDRRQMATSQSLTALGTPRHVGVAMMNIAGYNFDDGMPVSKAFAEAHKILGADGKERPLMIQDKLSDFSGNKGVISAVVDPSLASWHIAEEMRGLEETKAKGSMDYEFRGKSYHVRFDPRSEKSQDEQAVAAIQKELGVDGQDELMRFFEDNPHVDIVMAPYSGMSRTNGGIARDLMSDHGDVVVNGRTVKGGMGYTNIIIVDMPADVKTHWYDEEAILAGKGRKASGQLAWALQSKKCNAIMREFYGGNQSALDDMREYAIAVGLDMDEQMRPLLGYHEQKFRGEKRHLLKLPDMSGEPEDGRYEQSPARGEEKSFMGYLDQGKLRSQKKSDSGKVRLLQQFYTDRRTEMMDRLNTTGGFMELPFQLDFKTAEYAKVSGTAVPDYLFKLQATGQTYDSPDGPRPTYGMPVLPIGLRSGQEFQDGTSMPHDFTNHYMRIYKNALTYMACEREIAATQDEERKAMLRRSMESLVEGSQKEFDKVVKKVVDTRFDTKYNVFREGLMSSRVKNSATAVWSADPRLKLDEVSMSAEHAGQLGLLDEDGKLKKDARVLLWRDPILHDDNVRYMKVVINNNVHGVCVNPAMDKCFDGDFDGDSVAIVALQTKEAQAEAFRAFSLEANMLQKGVVDKNGNHPLYVQTGLDAATAMYLNPELKTQLEDLTVRVNDLERKAAAFFADPSEENANAITAETRVRRKGADNRYVYGMETVHGKPAINALRRQYKDELSAWVQTALSGIGTAHIVVENEATLVQSVQDIVDSGAKGNQGKMKDYMDNVGIAYELGEDGRSIPSTARSLTKNGKPCSLDTLMGRQRDKDMAIQETAAYKADNTALGGTTAQNGVSAFRDYSLTEALELTYPITQAILQSKHDPKDAKVKDEIVRFWGKDIWDGYKLTGDFTSDDPLVIQRSPHKRERVFVLDAEGNKIPKKTKVYEFDANGLPKFNKDGNPVFRYEDKRDRDGNIVYETAYRKCTRSEWIQQMTGMMRALKVDVNPEYIEKLATIMTRRTDAPLRASDTGYVITTYDREAKQSTPIMAGAGTVTGLTDFALENGSLMDKAAYSGRFTAVVSEALKNDPQYVDKMCRMGRAFEMGNESLSSFMSNMTADAIAMKAKEAELRAAKAAKDAEAEAAAKAELKRMKDGTRPSASFAPRQFQLEVAGDAERRSSGAAANSYVRIKGGEEVVVTSAPRPVGSRNCRLSEDDYNAGAAYMGESQNEYEARTGAISRGEPYVPKEAGSAVRQKTVPSAPAGGNPFTDAFDRNATDEYLGISGVAQPKDGAAPQSPRDDG